MSSWEVVGSKSGKKRTTEKPAVAKNKKGVLENAPKIKEIAPITEDKTIFEAFLEKERRQEEQKSKRGGDSGKTNGHQMGDKKNKNVSSQPSKKKPVPEKKKPVTLQDVISQLSVNELRALLDTTRSTFPDTPTIWLKDLASFLNIKLNADIADPVFTGEAPGLPCRALSSGVYSLLKNAVNECTQKTLQLFFDHCLTSLIQDSTKNLPTFGFRIFLQCLALEKPDLIISNLGKLTEFRNSTQNRHQICLSILWAAGQVGLKDVKAGVKVWLELMFPVISIRPFTKYCSDYLENLFKQHPGTVSVGEVLGVREFFPVFDLAHTHSLHTPGQLQQLYPKLRALAYGPDPSSVLRNFFPSYLTRLQANVPKAMKEELLASLVECLSKDKQSYSVWRQLYTKHLPQSGILLAHLNANFDSLPSSFPEKFLQETLSTFRVTNEDLVGQTKHGVDGFEECAKNCNELLAKMSCWRFPWRFFIILFLFSVSALVTYDINQHGGSFKASKIGRYLKEYGVLAVWDQAASRVAFYSKKIYRQLEQTVPVYYTKACQTLGPYLRQFWDFLFAFAVGIWNAVEPLRLWVNKHVPPLLQNFSDNLPKLWSETLNGFECIANYLTAWLWAFAAFVMQIFRVTSVWLQEHVFTGELAPDKLLRRTGDIAAYFRDYTSSLYQWLLRSMSRVL